MKITEKLRVEHDLLRDVIKEIERACVQLRTLEATRIMAQMMEGLLKRHAAQEEDLVFVVFDHLLEERGGLERMSQDHDEIDDRLSRIRDARTVAEAQKLLMASLAKTKRHFLLEEREVFPAIERTLQAETLDALTQTAISDRPDTGPLRSVGPIS